MTTETIEKTKKTALYDKHIELGAKMVPFGGWDMPVQYKNGIIKEHLKVRDEAGVFDVSHMGEFFVFGSDSAEFLNKLIPQDITTLKEGGAMYCHLLNEKGGVIDDLIIYNAKGIIEETDYLLVVNASGIENDFNTLKQYLINASKKYNVRLKNKSEELSMVALQGPKSASILADIGFSEIDNIEFFHFSTLELSNTRFIVIRGGYTGEDGFEIIGRNQDIVGLWDKIIEKGVEPIGLGARDTLRLEAGLPLYGHELNENSTPLESSLGFFIPKDKKDDYIAKDFIMAQKLKQQPLRRKLLPFIMEDRMVARNGYEVYIEGKKCGVVTSGAPSPTLGKNIGFCMVEFNGLDSILVSKLNNPQENIGMTIQVMVRNKLYNAKIVKKPFVEKNYKK